MTQCLFDTLNASADKLLLLQLNKLGGHSAISERYPQYINMIPTYRRFNELRTKAKKYIEGNGALESQLTNAVIEISYMRQNEVPEYAWDSVQAIISSCQTHAPVGQEGSFRASINAMSYDQLELLKRNIELL